jgi:ribosomal protein L11 methyltransferase
MRLNSKSPGNECLREDDAQTIRDDVIAVIASSPTKISPSALEKQISARFGLSKKQIKTVIRDLVSAGEFTYTYDYGSSFLERSFAKPVRISKHVVLKPPDLFYRPEPGDVVVQIKPGASFGAGRHPTTRLAINGIEWALKQGYLTDPIQKNSVLDIGTGSGVLVSAAVLCGMKKGLGIDIERCARAEAAENVNINGLQDRIMISGQAAENMDQRFSMITANLRYPSLIQLHSHLADITKRNGAVILSGVRDHELTYLVDVYAQKTFKSIWRAYELGWAGIVLLKSG